jgi:hypothetical protein
MLNFKISKKMNPPVLPGPCGPVAMYVFIMQALIAIVYGSILRPSSNNWASYRRLKWQIAALFLWNAASVSHPPTSLFHASR